MNNLTEISNLFSKEFHNNFLKVILHFDFISTIL